MSKKTISIIVLLCLIASGIVVGYAYQTMPTATERHEKQVSHAQTEEYYVYETEAGSADECSSYEQYDESAGVCFFECGDASECRDIESSIDEEIASWTDDDSTDGVVTEGSIDGTDDSLQAEYSVATGEKITLKKGEENPTDTEIWTLVSKISPDWLTDTFVDTFQIFDNADDDTIAFVDDEDGDGKWRIGINIAAFEESSDKEKNLTIVHELGHIITLNTSQLDITKDEKNCPLGYIDEGCPRQDSYLGAFVIKFWTQSDITLATTENGTLYESSPESFVSEYASTNFVEDLAESFSYFVFGSVADSDQSVAARKQRFFASYPDLVKIRSEMLSGVRSNLVRARKMSQ